jgi:tRNA(Arg) A34 adenosine deaminase TadA
VRYFSAPTCLHRPEVYGGIGETDAAGLLREFFAGRR